MNKVSPPKVLEQTFYYRRNEAGECQAICSDASSGLEVWAAAMLAGIENKLHEPALYSVTVKRIGGQTTIEIGNLGSCHDAFAVAAYAKDNNGKCELGTCFFDPPELAANQDCARALAFGLAEEVKGRQSNSHGYCIATAPLPQTLAAAT